MWPNCFGNESVSAVYVVDEFVCEFYGNSKVDLFAQWLLALKFCSRFLFSIGGHAHIVFRSNGFLGC